MHSQNHAEQLFRAAERGDINEIRRLIDMGVSIHQTDANGNNLVLQASAFGQTDLINVLISKKKGGFGLSLHVKNNAGNDPVLVAIANNQEALFKKLISKEKGGFGLSLHVKNIYKSGPVLTAIGAGNFNILNFLIDLGYEVSSDIKNINGYGPLEIAIRNEQVEMLKALITKYHVFVDDIRRLIDFAYEHSCKESFLWLFINEINQQIPSPNFNIASISAGALEKYEKYNNDIKIRLCDLYHEKIKGYLKKSQLEFDDFYTMHEFCYAITQFKGDDKDYFIKLFTAEFNRKLFDINCNTAVTWALNILEGFDLYQNDLLNVVTERFKKILENEFKKPNLKTKDCSTITCVTNALNTLSAGSGQHLLANYYLDHACFIEAFQHYLGIFSNHSCSRKMRAIAGLELANLIYNGCIILTNGELDITASSQHALLSEEKRSMEDKDLQIMQQRAIQAYEYISSNTSAEANILRNRLDSILSGDLTMNKTFLCWSKETTQPGIHSSGLGIFNKAARDYSEQCSYKLNRLI